MLRYVSAHLPSIKNGSSTSPRLFHALTALAAKPLPPRPTIREEDIEENFLKGSGPGGQKINKTSSAVQLKHLPTGIVVKCQETRSRSQNRKIVRTSLAEKIELLEKGDESRISIKAELKRKKKASAEKKSRRKYKQLETQGSEKQAQLVGPAEEMEREQDASGRYADGNFEMEQQELRGSAGYERND